jgi:hypothetical protein
MSVSNLRPSGRAYSSRVRLVIAAHAPAASAASAYPVAAAMASHFDVAVFAFHCSTSVSGMAVRYARRE